MMEARYRKMAGTSGVFVSTDYWKAAPIERDGRVWSDRELHVESLPLSQQDKPSMANVLALEGLEDYDKPENGDSRFVESMGVDFIYFEHMNIWVQK